MFSYTKHVLKLTDIRWYEWVRACVSSDMVEWSGGHGGVEERYIPPAPI